MAGQLYRFVNLERSIAVASRVRVAGTSRERRRGLLKTTDFVDSEGLWILPCEAIHTFGMKLAIDAVFLDRRFRVRGLRAHMPPWRVAFCLRAHSVLELPAGTIARTGTALGDQMQHGLALGAMQAES